jgi:hypothetical protein
VPTRPDLTSPPNTANQPARDTHLQMAEIIGIPGWLRSEKMAG